MMDDAVLLVGAAGAFALAIAELLRAAGFRVEIATDAGAVADLPADRRFAVVVVDAGGTAGDPDAVRSVEATAGAGLVMLIGRCGPVETEKARALGCDAVLGMPFSGAALVEAVRRVRRRASSEPGTTGHG